MAANQFGSARPLFLPALDENATSAQIFKCHLAHTGEKRITDLVPQQFCQILLEHFRVWINETEIEAENV